MPTKPTVGSGLVTSGSAYTDCHVATLKNAWGIMEASGSGAGTHLADTVAADYAVVGTGLSVSNSSGEQYVSFNGSAGCALNTSETIHISSSGWAVAWGGIITDVSAIRPIIGNGTTYIYFGTDSKLHWVSGGGIDGTGTISSLTGVRDDWLWTQDYGGTNKVYRNGSLIYTTGSAFWTGTDLVATDMGASASHYYYGSLFYLYTWENDLLNGTAATALHTNPYQIFSSGGGGGSVPIMSSSYMRRKKKG